MQWNGIMEALFDVSAYAIGALLTYCAWKWLKHTLRNMHDAAQPATGPEGPVRHSDTFDGGSDNASAAMPDPDRPQITP